MIVNISICVLVGLNFGVLTGGSFSIRFCLKDFHAQYLYYSIILYLLVLVFVTCSVYYLCFLEIFSLSQTFLFMNSLNISNIYSAQQ